jgi:hypothetical protein
MLPSEQGLDPPKVRVARGAELLDRLEPGWQWRVDPKKLDLRSLTMCVIGQLYGVYCMVPSYFPMSGTGISHGFILGSKRAWKHEINFRRNHGFYVADEIRKKMSA